MERRDFLKSLGLASSAILGTSCVEGYHWTGTKSNKLIPALVPADDGIIPGDAMYYPSTCEECPAQCSMIVKVQNEKPVKLEGNPNHPLTKGGLCMRGQAHLTRVFHPERIQQPLKKDKEGKFQPIFWGQALEEIVLALSESEKANQRSLYLSGRTTGTLSEIIDLFCQHSGIMRSKEFEPYSWASLRQAYSILFGINDIPAYKIEESDFLLTIGADILETFLQPVAYTYSFAQARQKQSWKWLHVEPHVSLTGLKADKRISIQSESEVYLLVYLIQKLQERFTHKLLPEILQKLPILEEQAVVEKTGISKESLAEILQQFGQSQKPLLLCGGVCVNQQSGLEVALLSGLLQWGMGMLDSTVDFAHTENYARVGSLEDFAKLNDALQKKEIGVLFISRTDPISYVPSRYSLEEFVKLARLRVGLGDIKNKTLEACDIILPLSSSLECTGDRESRKGYTSLVGPVIKASASKAEKKDLKEVLSPVLLPRYQSKPEANILLEILERYKGKIPQVPITGEEYAFQKWSNLPQAKQSSGFLRQELFAKGYYEDAVSIEKIALKEQDLLKAWEQKTLLPEVSKALKILVIPSVRAFDGRSKSLPLLEEVPDPLTTITYSEWVSVSPDLAKKQGLQDGDIVELSFSNVRHSLPAKIQALLPENLLLLSCPQSMAKDLPIANEQTLAYIPNAQIQKAGKSIALPILSGSMLQKGRGIIAPSKEDHDHHDHHHAKHHEHAPKSFFPKHEHEHKWTMVIDPSRCTACGACVASCYMENNIPLVGKEAHIKGREMSWLRIEPYIMEEENTIRFSMMLCQHCEYAPCEAVCPAYAAYHNPEGLNAQVYSRCVGTRYCANNCPYKVRRFNWADHPLADSLKEIVNPDVPLRTRGVMEKCTFCVQRIRKAKDRAKDENRKIQDGEVMPACAQSCPAHAIVFGDLLDKESQVYRLVHSGKIHRIHENLGVEPAVYILGS